MSRLKTHLNRAREFKRAAELVDYPDAKVQMWCVSAHHFIEACAAKKRQHIHKPERVADELNRNPAILGSDSGRIAKAFRYLDREARAKFVDSDSGTKADLERARKSFELVESTCEAILQ
ncbi:MAG: hypothetical protein A3K65_04170 [Euryarchaeota archaeon RBG_16_68_12]|nr:MAG: hypothetical protein A3K65_04170 [Euryarchaeota archaeon RBG_16_68_12]